MNTIFIIILIIFAIVAVLVGANLYIALRPKPREESQDIPILHQRLDSLGQILGQRMDTLGKVMGEQIEKTRESEQRATLSVFNQVQNFTQGMTQVQETINQMRDKVKDIISFQDIFKSPKLRGTWGEFSLEAALGQYFSKDIYELQHYFKSGEAVDAALKLPNNLLLPIDSKFNWENFEKMVNADNEINREIFRKTFVSDVKKKIDEIATKYILPPDTTDFALMYVPAETIYYEIINNIKDPDIPAYARGKKVYLVSPNSFGLSVSSILQWFQNVDVSKRTKDIIARLSRIKTDGEKLGEGFRKLGKHISEAHSSYDDSEKRLTLMVDRVKNVIQIGAKEEPEKLEAGID